MQGVQDPHVVFDWDGEIVDIQASISIQGTTPTPIQIQKSTNFTDWLDITDHPVIIDEDCYLNNQVYTLINSTVKKGDVFRLHIPSFSVDAQNLSVNVKVALK